MEIDSTLLNDIETISMQLNQDNRSELFRKGHERIVQFRNSGGNKEVAYDTVHELHLKYMDTDEWKMDLIDDWLDCIIGWYNGNNIMW